MGVPGVSPAESGPSNAFRISEVVRRVLKPGWVPALAACGMLSMGGWACASQPGGGPGDPNMISAEEVEAAEVNNAYELIERLRPMWLRSRGGRSTRLETEIVVYLNRAMVGGIDALQDIPIEVVRTVRVLDAAEAGRLPGLGSRHVERAILVETARLPE